MDILLVIFGVVAVVFAAFTILEAHQNRELHVRLKEAKENIARTSRLMIEKNVELFDQNVNQQKQLAVKDDFIAIASHQLRTPLNEIKWGMGELLESSASEKEKRSYQQIFDSAKRMEKIVEDLLQFVEVEQAHTRVTISPYDPDAIVRASAERIANDFHDSGVSLKLDLAYKDEIVSIDPPALEMIVDNLIENAFHYTAPAGVVTVHTFKGAGDTFHLEINDTGIGIPEAMTAQMFLKFRRSPEAIARNKGGSGLGLYVVKTLLERANGEITFESTPGTGTTFRIVLLKDKASSSRKP